MRKRRVYLGALVLAVAGWAGLVGISVPSREPIYRGRSLSHWVAGYHMGAYCDFAGELEAGASPIREIGTNALPFLLDWIQYNPPACKAKFYDTANSLLEKVQCKMAAQRRTGGPCVGRIACVCRSGSRNKWSHP